MVDICLVESRTFLSAVLHRERFWADVEGSDVSYGLA